MAMAAELFLILILLILVIWFSVTDRDRRGDNKKPTAVSSRGFLLKLIQLRQAPTASFTTRTTSATCRSIPFIRLNR